jgi:hypothetical protein
MVLQEISVNYLAVLVAAITSFVIGALWYSQILFGKLWEKLQGIKMGSGKNMAVLMTINFIGALIFAYVLVHTIKYAGATSIADALMAGFFTWLGYFAVTTLLGTVLWENKPIKLYLINSGYWLVDILVMSIILTLWV